MAQALIKSFLGDLIAIEEMPDPIVEFGALQVEPDQDSDLRPLFPGRDYLGTDIREGPGVDRVEDVRSLSFGDGEVGTAICLDTLEHVDDPLAACREMHRVVADGGVCVVSSVMLCRIHGYPNDYFRFTPEGLRSMLAGFDDVWVAGVGHPDYPVQVVGVGAKGRKLDISFDRLPSLADEQRRWDAAAYGVRLGVFMVPPRDVVRELARQAPRIVRQWRARRRLRGTAAVTR